MTNKSLATPEEAAQSAIERMAKTSWTSTDFVKSAKIISSDLVQLPCYHISFEYEADWIASFGYDRIETQTVYEERSQVGRYDGQTSITVPVEKSTTVTDWRPVNGSFSGSGNLWLYAGDDLDARKLKIFGEVKEGGSGLDAMSNSDLSPQTFQEEEFATWSDSALATEVDTKINTLISNRAKSYAQGDRSRDWKVDSTVNKSVVTSSIPANRIVIQYDEKTIKALVNLLDASDIQYEAPPMSYWKIVIFTGIAILIIVAGLSILAK